MFNSPPRVQSRAQGGGFWYKVCTLHIFASHRGKFDINLGEGASSPQVSLSWPTGLLPPLDYTVSNSRFHAKRLPLCPLFHRCGWSSFSCFFFFFFWSQEKFARDGCWVWLEDRSTTDALRECTRRVVCVRWICDYVDL